MAYILKNNARPSGSEVRNIKVGDTETKYIISGDGALFYDIQLYIIYDTPVITFIYPDTVTPAKGGTIRPTNQTFTLTWRRVGYSGNTYELEEITDGATITYHVVSGEGASVDENGEVTWESRGIILNELERSAVIQMTVISNGLESYTTATVKLAKNIIEKIDYNEPTGKNLTVLDIPAKGGMIESGKTSGTIIQTRTDTYSSEEKDSYEINPEISSSYYSDPVIAETLSDTIKKRSIVGELIYYYTCNNVEGSCSADVYQQANVVEEIAITTNVFKYDDIEAGAISATPTSTHSPELLFTSETWSTNIPASIYGSLSELVSYSLNDIVNGFNSCDWQTGELVATSRGIVYGSNYATSGTVTKTLTYTWSPEEGYGETKEVLASIEASCRLKPNIITKLELSSSDAGFLDGLDTFVAKEDTKTVTSGAAASSDCIVTFSSGDTTYDYLSWVTLTIEYTWSSDKTYALITSYDETCAVTMKSRGTEYSATARKATITRSVTITASLKEGYIEAESVSKTLTCSTTVKLDVNIFTSIIITVIPGEIEGPEEVYTAKKETKSINNSNSSTAHGILIFSSEDNVVADNTYGSWTGPTYSWTSSETYATCSDTGNVASINVTMSDRGVTVGPLRSATITRNVTWKYTLDKDYGGYSESQESKCTTTVSQEANEANVTSKITYYGTPTVEIGKGIVAGGGSAYITAGVTNTRTYYYTSGSPGDTTNEAGSVSLGITSLYFALTKESSKGEAITRFSLEGTLLSHESMLKAVGYDFVTVTAVNAGDSTKHDSDTINVQNIKDDYSKITEYGKVSVSIGSGLKASGGSATVSHSLTNTRTYYYTSGEVGTVINESGSTTIEITKQTISNSTSHSSTAITRFSLNGNTLNHTSMTNNTTYDVVTITATGLGSKSNTATATVKNVANASSAITKYGTPTISIGSGMTAAGGKATVTHYVYNTKTYYYTSGTAGDTESVSGTTTIEITANGNDRFSLDGNTLSHKNMTNNAVTDKVTVKATNADATDLTKSASKSITNYADSSYGTPEITAYSYAVFPSEGATKTPTVTYRLYSYYSSGTLCDVYTSGGTLLFKMDTTTGFTLDSTTTGKMTTSANNSTSTRSAEPKVRVTMNSLTSAWYTTTRCVLEGVTIVYKINNKSLTFSAAGETKTVSVTYSVIEDGVVTSSSNKLTGFTLTEIEDDDSMFTVNGTSITSKANYYTSDKVATYTISKSGYTSGTLTCTAEGDTIYDEDLEISSNNFTSSNLACSSSGGSCTITASIVNYWVSGDTTYFWDSKPTITSSNTNFSIGTINKSGNDYTTTGTWSANTDSSVRTTVITVLANGLSKKITLYQAGKESETYPLNWNFSVFNVTDYIYSFGFSFTNTNGNSCSFTGGGGSGGTNIGSRTGTAYIQKTNIDMFRPSGFYLTTMNNVFVAANNSSGYYQDGTTKRYYYIRWSYSAAPTANNYKTWGYKFYNGIVESWSYHSASTLYIWVYQE